MNTDNRQELECPHCKKILESVKMPPSGKGMMGVIYEIERYHLSGECAALAKKLGSDPSE